MFNVSFLQLLCEVKKRAIEELQLQEQLPGRLLSVKHVHHTIIFHSFYTRKIPVITLKMQHTASKSSTLKLTNVICIKYA